MSQPTDPRASNGAEAQASPSDASAKKPAQSTASRATNQDTILLSEVPDSATMLAEPADWGTGGRATQPVGPPQFPNLPNVHLSAAAITALAQRYDILSDAGQGSMGNVFKARDRETGETIALKLLKPEIASDQAMMDRFKNELLFARKITHKNVCRVYDFNRIGGVAYTSMEFVEGESLRSVLNRFGSLPVRKATDLALQICSGLKEAHAQGIVHRDLKPENVMVDERGNVKIMDFGIARSMDVATRLTGAMVGTPAYMAPEQVAGSPVDYRTDIYSLGLILYEIFTGAQAFSADNAVAVAMKQLREAPVPPHEVDPGVPAQVERAILKCLEKEPAKRFQSVAELEKALSPGGVQLPPVASAGNATTNGRSTGSPIAAQVNISAASTRQTAPRSASAQQNSSRKWIALVAVLALALVAAGAGKWAKRARLANQLSAPAETAAPEPPDFALDKPAAAASSPASLATPADDDSQKPSPTAASAAAPSAPQPSPKPAAAADSIAVTYAALPASAPPAGTTPKKSAVAANANAGAAPADVQQRADAAFKEPSQAAAATTTPTSQSNPPLGSVLRGNGPSYIWVGRYEREDRAQDASRKIQGLGLPSVVVPRRSLQGQAYVVFTGPFTPQRISSVIDWLKTQGFPAVREVKGLGVNPNSVGEPDGGADATGSKP